MPEIGRRESHADYRWVGATLLNKVAEATQSPILTPSPVEDFAASIVVPAGGESP